MQLNKRNFCLALATSGVLVCLFLQSFWIFSNTTTARIYGVSRTKRGKSQINRVYATYQVNYRTYSATYLRNGRVFENHTLQIRYLSFAPGISRSDNFISNWGSYILVTIVYLLFITIIYIRKDIIADQAQVLIQRKLPFIKILNNEIPAYNAHVIDKSVVSERILTLERALRDEQMANQESLVNTCVYDYNPKAIGIIILYVFYTFWFLGTAFTETLGNTEFIICVGILIFVPAYIRNTNNPVVKMKIPGKYKLKFSARGILFKEDLWAFPEIKSAVVYLESFQGFTYRDRTTTGNINTVSAGDNNKISFFAEGTVTDFTFILQNALDYWTFKNLIGDWASRGLPVVLRKVFEDGFVLQEMVYFETEIKTKQT